MHFKHRNKSKKLSLAREELVNSTAGHIFETYSQVKHLKPSHLGYLIPPPPDSAVYFKEIYPVNICYDAGYD